MVNNIADVCIQTVDIYLDRSTKSATTTVQVTFILALCHSLYQIEWMRFNNAFSR